MVKLGNTARTSPTRPVTAGLLWPWWFLLGVTTAVGCANHARTYVPTHAPMNSGDQIAVLPLVNLSQIERAQRVVHEALVVEIMHVTNVLVIDPGLVREAMRAYRIWASDLLERGQMEKLGSALGVQYLLVGTIHEFSTFKEEGRDVPVVSIHLRLIDITAGEIRWAGSHTLEGDDRESVFGFGRINSLDRLAQIVVQETLASLIQLQLDAPHKNGEGGREECVKSTSGAMARSCSPRS